MKDFIINDIGFKQCNGLILNKRCSKFIICFSKGIYFCKDHGYIIFSPFHNLIYGYFNDFVVQKHYINRYFCSDDYNRKLCSNRYKKIIEFYLYNSVLQINNDLISQILLYL